MERSIPCMGKKAASVVLKLFIRGNEKTHNIDAPVEHKRNSIVKCKQHTIYDSRELETYRKQNNKTTKMYQI